MDVQDLLRSYEHPWKAEFETRLGTLPPGIVAVIRDRSNGVSTADQALTDLLHTSDAATRHAIAAAFFPHFPDVAARTLDALLTRHPYPQGYARRAFRAPGHVLAAAHAHAWLWQTWHVTREYPQPIEWFAVHAGLMNAWQSHGLGVLLGQAISDGNEQVFQILRDTAGTQHPVARMGRHVPAALLSSTREDAWALAEGLLLAAQRQEGLRQVILETVDEASPDAFTRTLRLILNEDLLRFAATLRAACVWFGLNFDVTDVKTVRGLLTHALAFLEDAGAARNAVVSGPAVDAYLALFVLGMRDAVQAADVARPLLTDADPARRMAAAQFLMEAELLTDTDRRTLLLDADLRLAALAGNAVNRWSTGSSLFTFEEYETYVLRLPDAARHDPLLFPWMGHVPVRAEALDALTALRGERPFTALAPHLSGMSVYGKSALLRQLGEHAKAHRLDAPTRTLLLTLLQDRNSSVSQEAVTVMAHFTPHPDEVAVVQTLLKRKSADLRRGLIRLLAADPDTAQASATALLGTTNAEQRQAGLQLLLETGRPAPEGFSPKSVTEQTLLARLTDPASQVTLRDGLGLFDPAGVTRPTPPTVRERPYPADLQRGAELLRSLDALIVAHRETPLTGVGWDGQETTLLGNVRPWHLRPGQDGQPMPLHDLWQGWWQSRPEAQDGDLTRMLWTLSHFVARTDTTAGELSEELGSGGDLDAELLEILGLDQDDLETLADTDADEQAEHRTAVTAAEAIQSLRRRTLHCTLGPLVALRLECTDVVRAVVSFLHGESATPTDTDMALDAWETALSYLPLDAEVHVDPQYSWRSQDPRDLLSPLRPSGAWTTWTPQQIRRLWTLGVYQGAAFPKLPRQRPATALLLHAYAQGWATRSDLYDQLIGERPERQGHYYGNDFDDLSAYTRRTVKAELPTHPDWLAAVAAVRDRVLEVELGRGDLETPATRPALAVNSLHGAALALRLLAGLGKNPLKRGYQGNNESRDVTFSHLIRVSFPQPGDTPEGLRAHALALNIPDARLLDLAMFAPQWATLVAGALGWRGLHDGVYWLHAHTRDSNWSVPADVRESWEAEISERTPLSATDLTEGAVDVAWFHRTYRALGKGRFAALLDAAKYASSSGGHKRAELYARAVLGELDETELRARIHGKRSQDAVRSLGLLPLARAKGKAAKALEERYRVISDFRREARQFGAQRQASERLAADIGLQNLARTAGYTDPQRLVWAMEARTAPDWTQTVTVEGVALGIALAPDGEASVTIQRGDRSLKTLPPALKKLPEVVALRSSVSELNAARTRMRAALEEAMIRGDHLQPQELRDLAAHPVIAPMLRGLVWIVNEAHTGWWDGDTLHTPGGPQAIGDHALRLAHPHDLCVGGHWTAFQAQVMDQGLTQPFKQVFREYYPPTAAELGARRSTRFDGHHVQPTKAAALFKTRGWITVPEEGVRKTWHAEGINVWIDTSLGYGTPGEVEGTPLTAAYFVPRDGQEAMLLSQVPPRVYSETLRDLDLVVSVAHVGGVDPEASQSTVEMRSALLRETLRLLTLDNVRVMNDHALIDGHHARYTVHLGSGTVHRQPGGFLCIIPVHNQHQGRLFLPFADPDPRTAEVISKVLLLAEDRKIQDPTILEQLR
ncbi:hypothetical protein HNQ07_003691 [Deinococcus metalli]|uniref:DUF4132 domain-containing protein n=1 Tax=Deinococcus metalli TaxID=1141878 RepID=A0A7W8KHG1_9DEIO|nr:DUF4132 domain-containing protein [Deinococcus metalli]MBB5378190.1 hypothetical protein [Deinococcus metalli]GHF56702.1 hypothetical protein GCM10017781_36290 [Deinococcus metalli]